MNILITILTSYNEYILYETYKSIVNQQEHNLNYTIIIVVNSLNEKYFEDVKILFTQKNINIEIIETKSNGKPGMGHNSLFKLFELKKEYDYLIPIDGDDFLYPYALHQLSKILIYNPDIIVGGNEDTISNFKELYNSHNSIYLNNKYFYNIEPNILIKKEFTLDNKGTPYRLFLIHRNIFKYNIEEYYCEKCKVFDDYLFYLHILNLSYTTNLNIYYINLKNIYLYYKAHISSVCYQHSSECNDDLTSLVNLFPLLQTLCKQKVILKLQTLYISNYNNTNINYTFTNNNSITYNYDDFVKTKQYKMNYDFVLNLSNKIFESTLNFINLQINKIDILNEYSKKKLYLLLENFIINDVYTNDILQYFLKVCNCINFIADDIILLLQNKNSNILKYDYKHYFTHKQYISALIQIIYLLENKKYNYELYYYYNIICKNINKVPYKIINSNEITIDETKPILVFLDIMDIDYTPYTPYIKGLGGTQICYINLALKLTEKYNVIILNKKNSNDIILCNNIYTIKYDTFENMITYINNINPKILIYNNIEIGTKIKSFLHGNILLYMYEHICVYSHFNMKINQDYYNNYDKLIFVSNNQKETYEKYCKINNNKVSILYNSLSPIYYYNNIEKPLLKNKELSIIYCSNPQRGLECFIHIFPKLRELYPNITLKICSSLDLYDIEDGETEKNLYKDLCAMDGVIYYGSVDQITLKNMLNESLLFIYPTFVCETFCNTMIEAMSCGCYVISSNIGALKEVGDIYGAFVDMEIKNETDHPYYESIDINYINKIIELCVNVITIYKTNPQQLELHLESQISFIKNKYKINFSSLFN